MIKLTKIYITYDIFNWRISMKYFNLKNHAQKVVSIVLLMIICISTITYAVSDIDKLYKEIMSNDKYY